MISIFARSLVGFVSVFALVSCGGGGDIAGDTDEFSVAPDAVKFTDKKKRTTNVDSCIGVRGDRTVFTIVGGQSPFRIINSSPQYMSVDKTEVSGKDPKFTVTMTGSCGDPLTILVLDYHSRSTSVEISVEREKEDTPATTP